MPHAHVHIIFLFRFHLRKMRDRRFRRLGGYIQMPGFLMFRHFLQCLDSFGQMGIRRSFLSRFSVLQSFLRMLQQDISVTRIPVCNGLFGMFQSFLGMLLLGSQCKALESHANK